MNSVSIGEKTEAIILAELIKRDYTVLIPYGNNQRYDYVLDIDGRFVRVQCKTARLRNGCLMFNACSFHTITGKRRSYDGEVDIFVVYSPDLDKIYRLDADGLGQSPSLRVDDPKTNSKNITRWAKDYELLPVA